jgi:hypothetical protein
MRALERDNKKEADQRLREARAEYLKNHTERMELAARNRALLINEIAMVKGKLSGPPVARVRFVYAFSKLLACHVDGWVNGLTLRDKSGVSKNTITIDMRPFWSLGLINRSNHGYQPTPKFFQLAEHLQQEEPGIYAILKKG